MKKDNKTSQTKAKPKVEATPKYNTSLFKTKFLFQLLLITCGILLTISLISYFNTGEIDQSNLHDLGQREVEVVNKTGKFGVWISHILIYQGFGIAAFLIPIILIHTGIYGIFGVQSKRIKNVIFWDLTLMLLLSVFFGFFAAKNPLLGGSVGFEINDYLVDYLGVFGTLLVIIFLSVAFILFRFKPSPQKMKATIDSIKAYILKLIAKGKQGHNDFKDKPLQDTKQSNPTNVATTTPVEPVSKSTPVVEESTDQTQSQQSEPTQEQEPTQAQELEIAPTQEQQNIVMDLELSLDNNSSISAKLEVEPHHEEFEIQAPVEEQTLEENLASKLVQDFGEFDPTLELANYKFPSIEILKEYGNSSITINQEELETNKNNIVETLKNYKIDIAKIKATVGPTVTLYEIVPEAGVRISKIKNLEDDIALSLAALGIRIIAPIPGKGTIGIEVPNTNPSIVSMKSVISSPKFQNAEMELPVALGKTISNETFVVDLAKMPHLLMAGATGQGKSVGLNALLTSLLYKKHPAEVKFVLVDPKKVELTLFNKIERHYLAKLPDSQDAIITDNTKVIHTLNSLCIEMDNRYNLLKDASVRTIKEYNEKFKQRKLNPENGHQFLPYIVLVIDEFADLIMTAGKDVETPIARLAQLARAIGIHLIVATQRPSVNVITGIIKANFPARIAFRVTSKIDSRTILDGQGADQLIGRGDMLYTQGNDLVRVQCAFVDTPEVEKLTDYIGSQKAYPDAYLLPEYVGEEGGSNLDIDVSERDQLFKEAAEVIVTAQQGSASLLQRKLKLGYNRAGRIIDQLEAAGIVGPFEGSKARSVNIPDLVSLEQFLNQD
ncbi:DNA translocase FtsK [Myroides sp. LJL116]